jgi:hypothetical protein
MEDKIIELINQELSVDITQECRKREIIEARALYFYVIKKLYPKKPLKKIGTVLGKDHTTVIHALKNFAMYEEYNPRIEELKNTILNITADAKKPQDINQLQILEFKRRIFELENQLDKERNRPRYENKITEQLENLLIDTKGTEQHNLITLRLEAFYNMNKNIRL